jgi:hypothetical protein
VAVDDGGERAGQVGKRIDGVKLARLDKRGHSRPVLRPSFMAGKESVLPIEGNRPNGSLDAVVVDLDTTISQEDTEPVPVFSDVGQSLTKRRLASDARSMMRERYLHVGDQRR